MTWQAKKPPGGCRAVPPSDLSAHPRERSNRSVACPRMSVPVPPLSSVSALHEALERVRYSAGALMVDLGGDLDTNTGLAPRQTRELADGDRAQVARLFLLGQPVDAERAAEALAPATVADLSEAGWLVAEGDAVRCPLRITPHEGVLLVHDPLEITQHRLRSGAGPQLGREHAGRPDTAGTGRERPGRGHRLRHPGPAAGRARRPGGGHRREPARAGPDRAERGAVAASRTSSCAGAAGSSRCRARSST